MNKDKLLKFFQPKWWVLVILFSISFFGSLFLSIYLDIDLYFVLFIVPIYTFVSSIVLLVKRKHILLNSILLVVVTFFLLWPLVGGYVVSFDHYDSRDYGYRYDSCGFDSHDYVNPLDCGDVATVSYPIYISSTIKLNNDISNQVVLSFYNNHSVECVGEGASFRFNCASFSNSTFINFRTIQTPVHIGYHQVLITEVTPVNFSGTIPCDVEIVCSDEQITSENLYDLPVVESKSLFIEFSG